MLLIRGILGDFTMKTCFLFPGQGAQYRGMARDLWEKSQLVKDLFKLAADKTGMDMEGLLFEGTDEELKATDKTQIAMTLASKAASVYLRERGVKPEGTAGFSLGEYPALCEAGVIAEEDLFVIVKERGLIMERASRGLDSPSGNPGMAAVIGLTCDEAASVTDSVEDIHLALYNSPSQIVISGTHDGLVRADKLFEEAGALKYITLRVSGPFHCPLMEEARKDLDEFLSHFTFSDPVLPVFANVTGRRITSGEEARKLCVQQIVSTVRWVDEEKSILEDGFTRFLEVGPGTVLGGLWKSMKSGFPCLAAGTLTAVEAIDKE